MRYFKITFLGIFLCTSAAPALAVAYCAKHDALAIILESNFGEQQTGVGLAGRDAMVELYVSKKGTFTLVSTNTEGVSCIVGAGDSWEKVEPNERYSAM